MIQFSKNVCIHFVSNIEILISLSVEIHFRIINYLLRALFSFLMHLIFIIKWNMLPKLSLNDNSYILNLIETVFEGRNTLYIFLYLFPDKSLIFFPFFIDRYLHLFQFQHLLTCLITGLQHELIGLLCVNR